MIWPSPPGRTGSFAARALSTCAAIPTSDQRKTTLTACVSYVRLWRLYRRQCRDQPCLIPWTWPWSRRSAMRLEMGTFPVQQITFGSRTRYQDGHLEVDKAAVVEAVQHDPRIATVDLEIAYPG